jgi:hypothetical protein
MSRGEFGHDHVHFVMVLVTKIRDRSFRQRRWALPGEEMAAGQHNPGGESGAAGAVVDNLAP